MTLHRYLTVINLTVLMLLAETSYADDRNNNRGRNHYIDDRSSHNSHYVDIRRHDDRGRVVYREPRYIASFTSEPIRGGSSRRTRIIENPYANRIVTGITIRGIDRDFVHVEDIIAYPYRTRLSPLGFTLSKQHPPRYIRTNDYIEYISVAAKRKEYFVVTFHYD